MKNIYLLCGVPASGKSTWVKERLNEHSVWISRDNIRFSMVSENEEYFAKEGEVFNAFIRAIKAAIKDDSIEDIYIDATHLTETSRNKVLDRFVWGVRDKLYVVAFDVNLETCLERNNKRTGRERVPEYVIKNMAKTYTKPTYNEKYRYKNIIEVK